MSARSEGAVTSPGRPGSAPDEIYAALRALVERESGIVLGPGNQAQIREVLRERMRALSLSDPYEYILVVMEAQKGRDERRRLVADLTVGETSFFRTADHFLVLRDKILPGLLAAGARLPIRIWSAGCSTGEEAYSIAIAAIEASGGRFLKPAHVLATDIRPEFLAAAREGIYPVSALKSLPSPHHVKYFRPVDESRVRVTDEVRELVTFEEHNLSSFALSSRPFGPFSVIFCRNVMIYFRPETTRRIVAKFHASLEAGGVLFLGHSETMWGISEEYVLERCDGAFYYKKKGEAREGADTLPDASSPGPGGDEGDPKDSSPAMELVRRAEGLADRGRAEDAERACREAMALDPGCSEASYLLAVLLRREGYVEDALLCADRAAAADPSFVLAMVEAAECLALLGRKDEAATRWRETQRMLEKQSVRFPRLSPAAGMSVRTIREYVKSRLVRV